MDHDPEAVRTARALVTTALRAWGRADLIDDATLVVSELVTTALVHGSPKEQLIAALRDVHAVPEDALYEAAQYDDGADMAFLRSLWRDLYPDEPSPEHS